jgi:hypothetical protein
LGSGRMALATLKGSFMVCNQKKRCPEKAPQRRLL